ncbi:hypothetical protein CYLTODRAFT_428495 [Cylindrobasidium torrendii FP15055 ss-10]|uniref:Glycoside hydrolase family 65 protein n=1 Tax=Cylindrobasidium torrendii FP15055 ss-10 TaxID=1314674 RepID=A0A0D7BS75_9AGAR|nr:hypothetical protein CYLTODRAFT_428495 [Cylindrobasidium torrendii FP15055 ss-10]
MALLTPFVTALFILLSVPLVLSAIDRHAIVSRYNPIRNASSTTTPLQVGNGNFAFGADITGLQSIQPYGILSSWGWKNDSLPEGKTQADIDAYRGTSWPNHGREVQYDFGGNDSAIEKWLTANPNRVNLGRLGLLFDGDEVGEDALEDTTQELDLWTGTLTSQFNYDGIPVTVKTVCAADADVVGISIDSELLASGRLSLFIDFPWNDGLSKFSAPFVGKFNMTTSHTTTLDEDTLTMTHNMVDATSFTSLVGSVELNVTRRSPNAHLYSIKPLSSSTSISVGASFSASEDGLARIAYEQAKSSSQAGWFTFWSTNGFVDLVSGSTDERADELQRRVILSRYLMRVNEAGDAPPQESGLVNNGWYGKFHMEMYFWHAAHWALWNNWEILSLSTRIYDTFLPSSLARAQDQQGWASGARWPKMTDPSGRSAPGEINNLLLWQQPHPLVFAQYQYRSADEGGKRQVLEEWADVVRETANWMAAFAWYNTSTEVYDLGPPAYVVSEDTNPNATINPAFELAYWRLGLSIAEDWMAALGEEVPANWSIVREGLAQLPLTDDNATYKVYEGLEEGFWTDPEYTNDHPALVGLYGWLPPTQGLGIDIAKATFEKVVDSWNLTNCWGWDFPMLAMAAARNGETDRAVDFLLDPLFQFDDVGMPVGGVRVPTPYFPGSGGLLYAVAMMAAGWDGADGSINAPGFPQDGWDVRWEGLSRSI